MNNSIMNPPLALIRTHTSNRPMSTILPFKFLKLLEDTPYLTDREWCFERVLVGYIDDEV